MKNLIITSGIVIFMMTVMIFQSDCAKLRHMNQKIEWAAEDIYASWPVSDKEVEKIIGRYFSESLECSIKEDTEEEQLIITIYSQPVDMNLDILDGYLKLYYEKRAFL